ncbi:hypothetical protein LZ554_009024 [Drepanopeziza brunnea f. sp. 'monogermtubi']|nr:hypothetical protein LZ554_009024 [Drepanopeziza brunnea f. sp. 'monogermtubi']
MSGVLDIDSWKDQADRPFYTNLMLEAYGSDWYRVASAQVGRVIDTFQQDMWRNPATQPVLEPRPRYEIPQISLAAIAYTRARGEMRNSLVEKFRLLGQSYYFDVFLAVGTCLAQMKSFRGNSTLREIMTTCEDQRRSSETNISESRAGYMWMDIGVKGHDAIVYYVWIKSKYWEVATFLHLKLEHDRWIRFSTYLKH